MFANLMTRWAKNHNQKTQLQDTLAERRIQADSALNELNELANQIGDENKTIFDRITAVRRMVALREWMIEDLKQLASLTNRPIQEQDLETLKTELLEAKETLQALEALEAEIISHS
jgi:hypothetical protein